MGESRTPVQTRRFRVAGLGDPDAALQVEHALMSIPGVHRAICDFEQQRAIVRVAEYVADEALAEAVEGAGYTLMTDGADPAPDMQAPEIQALASQDTDPGEDLSPHPDPSPFPDLVDPPEPDLSRRTDETQDRKSVV